VTLNLCYRGSISYVDEGQEFHEAAVSLGCSVWYFCTQGFTPLAAVVLWFWDFTENMLRPLHVVKMPWNHANARLSVGGFFKEFLVFRFDVIRDPVQIIGCTLKLGVS